MVAKNCAKVRGALSAYLDGELRPGERSTVEKHLRECPACATELESLKNASAALRKLPEAALPENFHAILKKRVRAEAVSAGARSGAGFPLRGVVGGLGRLFGSARPSWSWQGAVAAAGVFVLVLWAGSFAFNLGLPLIGQDLAGTKTTPPGDGVVGSGIDSIGNSPGISSSDRGGHPGGLNVSGGAPENAAGSDGSYSLFDVGSAEGRKIVLYAYLTLGCDSVPVVKDRAIAAASAAGGFVESLTSWRDESGTWTSMLLRVPTAAVADVMGQISAMGEVVSEQVSRQDVTAEHVDLTARLNNLRQQEQRLLVLVGKAQSLSDVLVLENELNRIRTEIERYERSLRSLDERVAYSMLNITLQPSGAGVKPGASLWDRIVHAFLESIAWLGRLAERFVIFMASAVPVLALLGLGWLAFVTLRSRRRKASL